MKTIITLSVFFLGVICNAELRIWTAVNDKTVEAEFASLEKGTVKLKLKTGKIVEVPISKFIEKDRELIKKLSTPENHFINQPPSDSRSIEKIITEHLSNSLKVSGKTIDSPEISKCFSTPFYTAEVELSDLLWKQPRTFALTTNGVVMIQEPPTDMELPELLDCLDPDFTMIKEDDGEAMLSALKEIYPNFIDDDVSPRVEKRKNKWVFIFDKFFQKFSGFVIETNASGKITSIERSLGIEP